MNRAEICDFAVLPGKLAPASAPRGTCPARRLWPSFGDILRVAHLSHALLWRCGCFSCVPLVRPQGRCPSQGEPPFTGAGRSFFICLERLWCFCDSVLAPVFHPHDPSREARGPGPGGEPLTDAEARRPAAGQRDVGASAGSRADTSLVPAQTRLPNQGEKNSLLSPRWLRV